MKDAKLNSRAMAIEPVVKLAHERGGGQWSGAALAALDQDRCIEDEYDQEFQADQDRQHLDRKINLPVAKHGDDRHREERVDPPRQVDTKILADESRAAAANKPYRPICMAL